VRLKTIDFSKFSSIKIGKPLDVVLIEKPQDYKKEYYLIGSCNNILIGDNPPQLAKLSKVYDYIEVQDGVLKIGGATPSGKIVSFCKKNNIANFEFLSHLPGTLGGLVYMNAGVKEYEIFNNLLNIKTISKVYDKSEINYGYRHTDINEPILEASFKVKYGFDEDLVKLLKQMRSNQPKQPSAGSCFKNPKGDFAGRLIEAVGLKGLRVGDMEFSQKHANFLINHGKGEFKDAIHLIKEAQKKVLDKFGISLECEVVVLG
jgi:UDP-N-acetylmuramate dehydrogenase